MKITQCVCVRVDMVLGAAVFKYRPETLRGGINATPMDKQRGLRCSGEGLASCTGNGQMAPDTSGEDVKDT